MRYFIYLILLLGFATAQAQDQDQDQAQAQAQYQDQVFNLVESRAKACQQYEEIRDVLSCEGEDCPPLYESAVPFLFQFTAHMMCAFTCAAGERLCDESLHSDNEDGGDERHNTSSKCGRMDDEVPTESRIEWFDDKDGKRVKHIKQITTYSSGCQEFVEYIEVCNETGAECQEIEVYSEEWYSYKRQKRMEAYEESCFIATEADCKDIEAERGQCMLDLAESISETFCSSSKEVLWRYRRYGVGIMGGSIEESSTRENDVENIENVINKTAVEAEGEMSEGNTAQE